MDGRKTGTIFKKPNKMTQITKQQVEQLCSENGLILINPKSDINQKILDEYLVESIAANVCKVHIEDIKGKSRKQEIVCARWLVLSYFNRFAKLSRNEQSSIIGKDHSTASNAIKQIELWRGWRLANKSKFESIINKIHDELGIDRKYK